MISKIFEIFGFDCNFDQEFTNSILLILISNRNLLFQNFWFRFRNKMLIFLIFLWAFNHYWALGIENYSNYDVMSLILIKTLYWFLFQFWIKQLFAIGRRPTGATSTVNKRVSLDINIFLHHICRAFLCESYKGWSHIILLAQWLFTVYMKSKNQLKTKKSKVARMFPIKSWFFWPMYIFKRLCS